MDRRSFVAGLASAALVPTAARAAETCTPGTPWQPPLCISQLNLSHIRYEPQRQSLWCWAAVTQIIFEYYGFRVNQETIVQAIYGRLVNMPAMNSATITRVLSGRWQDVLGRRFSCQISGLFDAYAGANRLNNYDIINALRAERPLYYCNESHAMVLTAIQYQRLPGGPNVVNLGLIDPWPGRGARGAERGEMLPAPLGGRMTYLALPYVRAL